MAKPKAYAVTVGKKIGVFTRWLDVIPLVAGVSGAQYQGFSDWGSANDAFEDARARGDVKVVRDGPPASSKHHAHRPKQEPRRGASSRSPTSLSSAGRAMRDAIIAETLEEEARREREATRTSGSRDGQVHQPSTRSTRGHAPQTTQQPLRQQLEPTVQPVAPPTAQSRQNVNPKSSSSSSSDPSTSSSPPTGVTNRETGSTPRYAQSLSYASDASPVSQQDVHMASPTTGSSALATSDWRSDVSQPSTGSTKYFPADFLTRERDAHTKARADGGHRQPMRSPATTVSEYATPSGSARTQLSALSPRTAAHPEPPATQTTAVSSPVSPSSSGPSVRIRRRKIGKEYHEASVQVDGPPRRKRNLAQASIQASEDRQHATAEVQTSPMLWERANPIHATTSVSVAMDTTEGTCGCAHPAHVCRHCGLSARVMQSVANSIASPVFPGSVASSPPRSAAFSTPRSVASPASRSIASPVPRSVVSPSDRSSVAAPAPRPSVTAPKLCSSFSSPASRSSVGSPVSRLSVGSPASFSSPLAYSEVVSSPPSSSTTASPESFHSALSSPVGGHTPMMGSSERRSESVTSPAELQDGLDMMVPSSPTNDSATAVLHDVAFDPRSPLQRGTMIPSGSRFDSLMRPSPMLTPLNSLLFS